MSVSTVIITRNEEAHIEQCVRQALRVSSEVIVVDAESDDQTRQLAEKAGARVIIREWQGYGNAKNFGNLQASNDWILSLDGDEVLSEEFITQFSCFQAQSGQVYELDIQTIYRGKPLRHSGFYPLWKTRLFDRKSAQWDESEVHEKLIFSDRPRKIRLKGKVWHYSIGSPEQFLQKQLHYARLGAEKMWRTGSPPGILKRSFGPAFRFFKCYILDLGFLDGRAGFELAVIFMKANREKLNHYLKLSR